MVAYLESSSGQNGEGCKLRACSASWSSNPKNTIAMNNLAFALAETGVAIWIRRWRWPRRRGGKSRTIPVSPTYARMGLRQERAER